MTTFSPPIIKRLSSNVYQLTSQTIVNRCLEETFEFFARAENLNKITPPWLRFNIVSNTPIRMGIGTIIEYRLKLRGFPMKWVSEIPIWQPPHRFVDQQKSGPYRYWRHEHLLQKHDKDSTQMKDIVTYKVPFGRFTHALFVKRDLKKIFKHRHHSLRDLLY